jgi:hypothetical protein
MTIINNILCKTANFVECVAEFAGRAVGLIVKYAIISAFTLSVSVAALLLWISVPYFAGMALIGDDINSMWQVYAMFGILAVWVILSKIVYDRLGIRK